MWWTFAIVFAAISLVAAIVLFLEKRGVISGTWLKKVDKIVPLVSVLLSAFSVAIALGDRGDSPPTHRVTIGESDLAKIRDDTSSEAGVAAGDSGHSARHGLVQNSNDVEPPRLEPDRVNDIPKADTEVFLPSLPQWELILIVSSEVDRVKVYVDEKLVCSRRHCAVTVDSGIHVVKAIHHDGLGERVHEDTIVVSSDVTVSISASDFKEKQ